MTGPRVSGALDRRWPPTPADRQADAVAEVCRYIAGGALTATQHNALVAALHGGGTLSAPILPASSDGAVVAWSWPRGEGDGR